MDNSERSNPGQDIEPQPVNRIIRGVAILDELNKAYSDRNPSRLALSIKAREAFNLYDRICDEEQGFRNSEGGKIKGTELRRRQDAFVVVTETEEIPPKQPPKDFEFNTVVEDASDEEVEDFFDKFAMTTTPGNNLVVFGLNPSDDDIFLRNKDAFDDSDGNLAKIASQIDRISQGLHGMLGIPIKPSAFLYRTNKFASGAYSGEYMDRNKGGFIDVWIPSEVAGKKFVDYSLEEEVGIQLTRNAIEDYDLVNQSRRKVVGSPLYRRLTDRIERLRRMKDMHVGDELLSMFEKTVDDALEMLYAEMPIFSRLQRHATVKDVEEINYNIKKLPLFDFVFEPVEMPYIFREGFSRFMGAKLSKRGTQNMAKDVLQVFGGFSSVNIGGYYREILTDEYAEIVMPAVISHVHDRYGFSVQEIAQAVSKTSSERYIFESFLENLQLDPEEVQKSWEDELRRSTPRN